METSSINSKDQFARFWRRLATDAACLVAWVNFKSWETKSSAQSVRESQLNRFVPLFISFCKTALPETISLHFF